MYKARYLIRKHIRPSNEAKKRNNPYTTDDKIAFDDAHESNKRAAD